MNDVSRNTSLSLTVPPLRLFQSDTMQIRGSLAQISAVVNKPSNLHIYHAYDCLRVAGEVEKRRTYIYITKPGEANFIPHSLQLQQTISRN